MLLTGGKNVSEVSLPHARGSAGGCEIEAAFQSRTRQQTVSRLFQQTPKGPLAFGICLVNLWIGIHFLMPLRSRTVWDLPNFYFAGKLVRSGRISQIYDKAAYEPLLAGLRKTEGRAALYSVYFNRPAFEAPLFLPLAFLSFRSASVLMIAANLMLILVLVWKLPQWFPCGEGSRIWLFIFMPFLYSVAVGQDTLLLTLILAYGLHLAQVRRDVPAGVVFALAAFKPHLILLTPFALAAAKKWRMLGAFLATGAVLGLSCFALVGARGVRSWIGLLRANTTDAVPLFMGNARALGLHFGAGVGLLAGLLTVIAFGFVLKQGSLTEKVVAGFLAAILLSPHTYLQDYALLAVAAVAVLPLVPRLCVLVPWAYFYPTFGSDMIPFIVVALACLVILAAKPLAQRFQATLAKPCPAPGSGVGETLLGSGKEEQAGD